MHAQSHAPLPTPRMWLQPFASGLVLSGDHSMMVLFAVGSLSVTHAVSRLVTVTPHDLDPPSRPSPPSVLSRPAGLWPLAGVLREQVAWCTR